MAPGGRATLNPNPSGSCLMTHRRWQRGVTAASSFLAGPPPQACRGETDATSCHPANGSGQVCVAIRSVPAVARTQQMQFPGNRLLLETEGTWTAGCMNVGSTHVRGNSRRPNAASSPVAALLITASGRICAIIPPFGADM